MHSVRPEIVDGSRLGEYFKDGLERALLNRSVQLLETTEFYLVDLLMKFEKCDQLYKFSDGKFEEEPLAMMLARALAGDKASQFKEFKRLGDISLYLLGFFGENLDKGPVGRRYYADMGSSAYSSLAGQLSDEKVFCELYGELSDRFVDIAHAFEEFNVTAHIGDNVSLLNLYERWLRTGDDKLKHKLIQEGLVPVGKKIS